LKQFEQDYEKAKCIDTEKKGGDTTESLVKHGNRLLDEDDRRLRGILTTVEETKQMGMDITDQLAQQTKQLEHINDEVYEINDEMKRSKAILVRMLRRVASNKYLWVMIVLIMMAIIFIIVWKVVKE
jgi:t-SNARE complex subunit (syntaxin)